MAFDASQFMSPTGSDYEITNSLRFNDDSAEQLTRTFSSAGNRKTFTYSVWLKRGNTSDNFFQEEIRTCQQSCERLVSMVQVDCSEGTVERR